MIIDAFLGGVRHLAATTISPLHPRDPKLAKMWGFGLRTMAGVAVDERKALTHTAVWRGVNVISNSVAKIPVNCYRRLENGGRIFDVSHRANWLLRNEPSPGLTPFLFRQVLQAHALLFGNGFSHIVRDEAARPLELLILDPARTMVFRTREPMGGIPRGSKIFLTNVGGQDRYLLNEDVLHIHGLGYDGLSGYSVVDLLREAIGLGIAMRQFGASFFGRGANASGTITVDGVMEDVAYTRLKQSFDAEYAGLGNAHKAILLEQGAKFNPLTIPPEQAQFLQSREFNILEIASILNVGAHKLGDASRKSYNSLEQSNQEFLDDDLDPWLIRWEQELRAKLLTEDQKAGDTHFIEFERKALMRMDASTRATFYRTMREIGVMSANDVCAAENLEPLGPHGDRRFVPANWIPADQVDGAVRTGPQGASAATDGASAAAVDSRFRSLVQADLRGISERLCRQAAAKRKLGAEAFATWVAAIDERQGPPEIHEFSVPMVRALKADLLKGTEE